jgi:hypothetical protein
MNVLSLVPAALLLIACGERYATQAPEPTATACPDDRTPATTPATTTVPVPWGLTRVLEGPLVDLQDTVSRRIEPMPEDCFEGEDNPPSPRPPVTVVTRVEAQDRLLEAVSLRYPGDIACAPIEYCALALRTARGWWITAHDENVWCDGVTGPSSRIERDDEYLEHSADEPGLLTYRGIQVIHTREHGLVDGHREESWSDNRVPFEQRCQVTSDDRVHCQR